MWLYCNFFFLQPQLPHSAAVDSAHLTINGADKIPSSSPLCSALSSLPLPASFCRFASIRGLDGHVRVSPIFFLYCTPSFLLISVSMTNFYLHDKLCNAQNKNANNYICVVTNKSKYLLKNYFYLTIIN